jgi:Ca-activated chloride channel family protein
MSSYPDWLSWQWFLPSNMSSFYWQHSLFLYLIPLIPSAFIFRWLFNVRFRKKLEITISKEIILSGKTSLIRHFPGFLFAISGCFFLLALARPQEIGTEKNIVGEGLNIVILLDISESMEIKDFKPNRLEASIKVARNFIRGRSFDRIGLVAFSGQALSLSPLTYDKKAIESWLSELNTSLLESSGTALGDAIASGINRLRESENKSRVIILISDGENTAGKIDPVTAAKLASLFDITIYSIAVGKEGEVPFWDKETKKMIQIESHIDETTLSEVAGQTGGEFFRATDMESLGNIFGKINQMATTPVKVDTSTEVTDYYRVYLIWGIIFLLLWLFTKNTFLTNTLED